MTGSAANTNQEGFVFVFTTWCSGEKSHNNMMSTQNVKLVGYILPPDRDNADEECESEEEEEGTVPEFLNMKEMESVTTAGAFLSQHSVPATEEGAHFSRLYHLHLKTTRA